MRRKENNMRKHYLSVFALAMVLIFGLASLAKAQHTVSVSSAPRTDYSNVGETFAATDIAEALATDTASLHELIMKEGGGAIYLSTADGVTNEYTGNTNEFWLNAEGAPVAYGTEECCWFVGITYNDPYVDEDTQEKVDGKVYVYTGQYPNFFKKIYDPSVLKCQLAIVSGEKKVTFDITQNVEAARKSELAEADTLLSKLNIVAEYEAEMQFVTGKQYEGKTATVAMSDVYEKLGAGVEDLDAFKADLESALTDHIFAECTYFKKENDVVTYYKSDTLRLPETVAPGSWFGRYINFNEDTGEEVAMESNLLKAWSAGCTFYTQSPKLADGEFSFTYGQYPNTMKAGDTDYAYLYVIVGGNAVRIKVQAKVADPEAIDPDKMVKVGEETVLIEAAIDNDYQTKSFTIDMANVLEKLGCEAADITDFYAYDENGGISDNHTEGSGGYYYSDEGRIIAWNQSATACFIKPSTLADGKFEIGQMANHFTDIKEAVTVKPQFLFQYEQNYYLVTVEYTVKPANPDAEPVQFTLVERDGISFDMVPSETEWEYATTTTIDLDYIEGKIGTKDFVLYTDLAKTEGEETTLEMSKKYTCDPKPGFWFGDKTYTNKEGQVVVDNAGWGSNSFGITYKDGVLTWWQYPGQRSVGDSYTANLYLVNEETGNYFQYVLNVNYVETETEKATLLDTFNKFVVMNGLNGDGIFTFALETQQIADSLKLEAADVADQVAVYAFKTPSTRSALSVGEELWLDAEGYVNDNNVTTVTIDKDNDEKLMVYVDLGSLAFENGNNDKAIIRLSFEANAKRVDYVYTIVSVDSPILSGISGTEASSSKAASIYNAAGLKVADLGKGINIIKFSDGTAKKVLVK